MKKEIVKSFFLDDPEILALIEKRQRIKDLPDLKGQDGVTPTDDKLISLIRPLIPKPIKGDDYVLTNADKKEIAAQIDVPVVEKIVEKHTEVVRELPMVTEITQTVRETNTIKEELTITPDLVKDIIKVMHLLPENDKLEVSKGLRNANSFIFNGTRYKTEELMHGGGGAGGTSTFYSDVVTGTIDGVNKIFSVPNTITTALALWLANSIYQPGVDFTTSGVTITMTVAPDASLAGQPFWLSHT